MATADVAIANLALAHCGQSTRIASLTEASTAARACLQFFEQARDEVLEAFPWGFARSFVALTLIAEDPTTEWAYSYRYPSDALAVRRILSGTRNDTRDSRVPYIHGQDTAGRLLYTDQADAVAEYTARVTDVTRFAPSFVAAAALLLASYVAPQVTGGDPTNLGAKAFQRYLMAIARAQVLAANEASGDVEPESPGITARS